MTQKTAGPAGLPRIRRFMKVLKGTAGRPTRFHTERGQMLPPAAMPELLASVGRRFVRLHRSGPWIVPSAVGYLNRIIEPNWNVYEFGSGTSTRWLAERCNTVMSVEHDRTWADRVSAELSEHGITNCELQLVDLAAFPSSIAMQDDESFNLIVVDGNEDYTGARLACITASESKLKSGGYLLLDDSDRPTYRRADELLAGWPRKRFVGVKESPLTATETTVYQKPSDRIPS